MRYDYFCRKCDEQVEITHGMFERITSYCPNCGMELTKGAPKEMMPIYFPWKSRMLEEDRW